MARMRTIKDAAAEIKKADANTAITPHAIRLMVLSGALPHVRIGSKYLINMDVLENALNSGQVV